MMNSKYNTIHRSREPQFFAGVWRLEVGSWKLEVGVWKLEVGGWKLEIGS